MLKMATILKAVLSLLLAVQASAAMAVTGMRYISTAGDYIGQGITQTYLSPSATITASGSAGTAQVNVSDASNIWTIQFASPSGSPLARGSYPDAARYPFNSPMAAGLSMYGDGRGCNTLKGWFRVREYELDSSGAVSKLAIDFLQNCEVTGPPLYGSVRINSDYPLIVPEMAAIAGADFDVIAGEAAALDASQSFTRSGAPLTFLWTQLDGPSVVLDNPSSSAPTFTAPDVGLAGDSLHFRLVTTDSSSGKTAHDDVVVLVESATAKRTQISFQGDPGDYITQGNSYRYDSSNAVITFSRNYDGGVSASISGDAYWNFDTAARTGTSFTTGTYPNAQRFPFQDANSPGLSLDGDGRGCNTLTGQFVVYQARFDSMGNPKKVDITFVQHCEGSTPAAYGEVLLNSVPHKTVAAQLRAARERFGRD